MSVIEALFAKPRSIAALSIVDVEERMKVTNDSGRKSRKGNDSGNMDAIMAGDAAPQNVDAARREEMIAVAAYFRAERRGFAPGDELDDWFQAEVEYRTGLPRNND